MLIIRCFLLLLMLTCGLTDNKNHNDWSLLTNKYNKRIKRFLYGKSSKTRLKSVRPDPIPVDTKLLFSTNKEKQSYTQQELADIKRILSKKQDDYYGILNLNKHATSDKIIQAHRKLTLRVHPDKFNAPGATEATQRLNKARSELLNQKQKSENQQESKTFTTVISASNKNDDQEEPNKSNSTPSPSSSLVKKKGTPKNRSPNLKSYYVGITIILFITGLVSFIMYWKKRQQQSYRSTHGNVSKKQKILPTYDSPESNDSDSLTINEISVASIVQD